MLSACSGDDIKRAFSLERQMPDEYTVVTRAPLSMPPSEKLYSPNDANRPTFVANPSLEAMETLSPEVALHPVKGKSSRGQDDLVEVADDAADNEPTGTELNEKSRAFTNKLMFFWKKDNAVVDDQKENERLQKITGLGGKMNAGPTPVRASKG